MIVVCLLLWLRSLTAYQKAQRSLQWWHGKQVMKLRHEAEELRNGLLQETFVLRRNLEVSLATPGKPSECSGLESVERVYGSLKDLSDRLSPPYIDESLPHAIQHQLQEWQSRYSAIPMEAVVPADWPLDRYEQHRAILLILDELLEISLAELPTPESISLHLWQQPQQAHLSIQLMQPQSSINSDLDSAKLSHLKQIFRLLISGQCSCHFTDSAITWHFFWKLTDS